MSDDWLSLTLADDAWIPPAERKEDLIARFTHMERAAWEEFAEIERSVPPVQISIDALDALFGLDDGPATVDPPDNSELDDAYCRFVASMSSEHLSASGNRLMKSVRVWNWASSSVISLGEWPRWDGQVSGLGSSTVWCAYGIGLHEIRAKLRGSEKNTSGSPTTRYSHLSPTVINSTPGGEEPVYTGPWQLGRRDIDPSTVLTVNPRKEASREAYRPSWWAPMEFDNWQLDAPIGQWVANDDDLPNLERGLVVSDPSNPDVSWINAYCFQGRRQPPSPDVRENDGERREIWYPDCGFPGRQGDPLTNFTQWVLSGQYWEGDGQMGIGDFNDAENIFFGEYGWSRGFQRATDGQPIGTIAVVFSNWFRSNLRATESPPPVRRLPMGTTARPMRMSDHPITCRVIRLSGICNLTWTGIAADHVDERHEDSGVRSLRLTSRGPSHCFCVQTFWTVTSFRART